MLQEEKEYIKQNLLRYYKKRVFTASALGFAKLDGEGFSTVRLFCGKTADGDGAVAVTKRTFFDTASLTKALVTVPCLLALLKDEKLYLQQSLPELLPYSIPKDKQSITLDQLIRHISGLPPHREYFRYPVRNKIAAGSKDIVPLILSEKLLSKPGERYCYSDLDYMLLGRIIEEKSGERLASYWQRKIVEPLGLHQCYYLADSLYIPDNTIFAETGRCPWSGALLRGLVHDDNCRAMGRLAGHTGLFSTLDGILFLCNNILLSYTGKQLHPSFSYKDIHYFATRRGSDKRAPGFDVPLQKGSSAGCYFSFKSIGHLGFTGTSFWIDLEKNIYVVLLTNRVYCGNDKEGIRKMRTDLHNRVMQCLLNN